MRYIQINAYIIKCFKLNGFFLVTLFIVISINLKYNFIFFKLILIYGSTIFETKYYS